MHISTQMAGSGSSLRLRQSMFRKREADIAASPAARCEGLGGALFGILSVVGGRPFAGFFHTQIATRYSVKLYLHWTTTVSVRCPCSDGEGDDAIVSTIDSGHLGALYGGQEGTEEAGLV
jgi:hypothetical protein